MPIIAQQHLIVNGNDDLSLEIVEIINSCGCIKTDQLAIELNTPLLELQKTLEHISGIECDKDYKICCADKLAFDNLVESLEVLK